jgi:hypothetical protein
MKLKLPQKVQFVRLLSQLISGLKTYQPELFQLNKTLDVKRIFQGVA